MKVCQHCGAREGATDTECMRAGHGACVLIEDQRKDTTCGTCKFMAASREDRVNDEGDRPVYYETTIHTCVRIIHGNHNTNEVEKVTSEKQPAVVIDGSGYQARLVVLPSFGCVLHEKKP